MEISAALTAEEASIDSRGLLHLKRAGWEFIRKPHDGPASLAGYIAGVVEFGPSEFGSKLVLRLTVGPQGKDPESLGSMLVSAHRHRAAFAIPFMFTLATEDMIVATLRRDDGTPLCSLEFPVRQETPPESS